MNSKKLLTLSATLLMALTVASCRKKVDPSSSSSSAPISDVSSTPVDASSSPVETSSSPVETSSSPVETSSSTTDVNEALWTAWAESVWDLYKEKNNTEVTGSFDVITVATTRDDNGDAYQAKVHFALEVTAGSTDAIKLNDKDDTHKTVYVGYYDEKVTEATTTKITISIEYDGNTRTISEILGNEKGVLNFTTPKLTIDNHAAWAEWNSTDEDKKNRVYNIRGTVIDVVSSESSSGGSFYMVDSEGYGYYVYKPEGESPKAGDEVVVTGKRSDYSGQEEFGKGATFAVTKEGVDTSTIAFKNGTADFAAAKSTSINDENLGAKYQNVPVTLEGCVPMGVTGNGYYTFKVGDGSAVFTLYDTYYFLTEAQRDAYKKVYTDAMESGHTLTISGICVSYSSQYQIYGSTLKADAVVTKGAEMSVEQKVAVAKNAILANIEETYDADTTIEFALPKYVTASYEVKNADPTVAVNEGKLVVTPTNRDVVNTVTVSVDAGGDTPTTFDITIVTEDNSVTKYTGRFDYTTFAVGTTETAAKVTNKKDPTQTENITFTHSAIIDASKYKEFNLEKATGFMTMTAPEGYTIAKVELKTYFDNYAVYAGTDATGTALEKLNVVNEGKNYTYTVEVNGASVYIANTSADHDASIYYVDVTLTKPNTGEEVAHKLTMSKADLKVLDDTQTSAYNKYKGAQTVGDYTVTVDNVMANTYCELDVIQMKKSVGTMSLEGTFSKITIILASTYDYDEGNAISVFFGEEEFTIDAATVNAARVDSGKKDSKSNTAYLYTVVADWGEEKTGTFSIKKDTDTGTAYITSIIFD